MPSAFPLAGGKRLNCFSCPYQYYRLFLMSLSIFTVYFSCPYQYYRLFLMSLPIYQTISHVLTHITDYFSCPYQYIRLFLMSLPILQTISHVLTNISDYFSCPYPYYRLFLMSFPIYQTISHVLTHITDYFSCPYPYLKTISQVFNHITDNYISHVLIILQFHLSCPYSYYRQFHLSQRMRFPTIWYLRPAYAQSDQSLCKSLEYYMSVKLMAEQHLEFLSFKGGCIGSPSESTLVKMPDCWKSHATAHLSCPYPYYYFLYPYCRLSLMYLPLLNNYFPCPYCILLLINLLQTISCPYLYILLLMSLSYDLIAD